MEERREVTQQSTGILADTLSDYHVVFVGFSDFLTWLRGFKDNIETLRSDLHVERISQVSSRFFGSYDSNSELLDSEFRRVYLEGGRRPLIIIGNPQSGPFSLYALLGHSSLLNEGIVAKLILLTPAFGSPLADLAESCSSTGIPLCEFITSFFGNQVAKFETARTRVLFEKAISALDPHDRNFLDESLYYVRGSSAPIRVTPFLALPYSILHPDGETDGISYTRNQKLSAIGNDLGVVPADHWDLFASMPAANSLPSYRKAFTRALLREVFER